MAKKQKRQRGGDKGGDRRTRICHSCSKVSFRSELDGKIALMKRVFKEKGEKRVYRCPARQGWHLTSKA